METIYPIFKKDRGSFYKFSSDKNYVSVWNGELDFNIEAVNFTIVVPTCFVKSEPSTEAEFLEAFYSVRKRLDDICLIKV